MEFREGRPVFRQDELEQGLLSGLFQGLDLQHREPRRVHFHEVSLAVHDLHTLRLGIEDGSEPGFARGEVAIRLLQLEGLRFEPAQRAAAGRATAAHPAPAGRTEREAPRASPGRADRVPAWLDSSRAST